MQELSHTYSRQKDALSCLFETIHMKDVVAQRSDLTPPWSIHVAEGMAGFYMVVNGKCHLRLDETGKIFALGSGDLAVLVHREAHCLQDGRQNRMWPRGGMRENTTAQDPCLPTTLVRGSFTWDEDEIAPLLPELPQVIHIKSADGRLAPWMIKTVQMIIDESSSGRPGSQAIVNHLAHVIFVQGIRAHLAAMPPGGGQVLESVAHRQIGPALYLLHARPGEPWSLISLARKCGMCRSAFAEEFRRAVGRPPMAYLLERRMHKACKLLSQDPLSIKEIAILSGYGSQPAFGNAFKRWAGMPPGAYRQSHSRQRNMRIEQAMERPEG
jgi:AraC-like DNA-binding protein